LRPGDISNSDGKSIRDSCCVAQGAAQENRMHALNTGGAVSRRPAPVAIVIASEFYMASHRRLLGLRGLRVEGHTPEAALADPDALPACALLLVETTGLSDAAAASLVALAAERRWRGNAVIFLCPTGHADFLAALLGTGATFLSEASEMEIDRALRDAVRSVWQRRLREARALPGAGRGAAPSCPWPEAQPGAGAGATRPYWLDILSDALTGLAMAHQATGPDSPAIAALIEQMVAGLLALPSDRALLDAVELTLAGDGSAELGRLVAELDRRGLGDGAAVSHDCMGKARGL
jgi:hypothetical protein